MSVERTPVQPVLTDQEISVLDFERQWWKLPMAKEQAIRETFGLSGPQYYQILNALIDRREALAADPLLVKRLRRMRSQRREQRHATYSQAESR
ncbi:MAG: DUF3263 domain-containing protein [Propionibacteriaceae bacterium]|jgi:hypothetical protein|nr:DUF3263 domain-containing protein [Propionibacteriaceae bacterium]